LQNATRPVTAIQLATTYLVTFGKTATKSAVNRLSKVLRAALHACQRRSMVCVVNLSGKEFQGWVLAEHAADLDRYAATQDGHFADSDIIFDELKAASGPLSTKKLTETVMSKKGISQSKRSQAAVACRVRACLRYHRIKGTFTAVFVPGDHAQNWVLTERLAKLCPPLRTPRKEGRSDRLIETILKTVGKPVTAFEVASRMRAMMPAAARAQVTPPTLRNRVYTYLRAKRLFGEVRIVVVSGTKSQFWELIDLPAGEATSRAVRVSPSKIPTEASEQKNPVRKSATSKPKNSTPPKPAKRPIINTAASKPRARRRKRS
jgi:hypothetical protein